MAYSYEDFEKALEASGLSGQFSSADLDTAKQDPTLGMGILQRKQAWNQAYQQNQAALAAGDTAGASAAQAAMEAAHSGAEANRAQAGQYSGGTDGSEYLPFLGTSEVSRNQAAQALQNYSSFTPSEQTGAWGQESSDAFQALKSLGSFSYDQAAPTYTNQYQQMQADALDKVANREDFSWSKEDDPSWSAYKKQYTREGQRATADTLAQASAMSGGIPSSYAVTAAGQAGDYYASQLADKIPELYQQAYERYVNEFSMDRQALADINSQEQLDYNRYLTDLGQYNTDRNFALDSYNTNRSASLDLLNAAMGLQSQSYNQDLQSWQSNLSQLQSLYDLWNDRAESEREWAWNEDERDYTRAQSVANSLLSIGETPTAEQLAAAGYSTEYADLMAAYYKNQLAKENADWLAGYGDNSGLAGLGVDTSYLTDQLAKENADWLAGYGDVSGLAGLGVDTSYLSQQLADQVQESYKAEVDAMLQAGRMPSAELVSRSGYSQEYVSALYSYYAAQLAGAYSGSSSGSSGYSSRSSGSSSGSSSTSKSSSSGSSGSSSSGLAADALAWAAKTGGSAEDFVKAYYKTYGYTSVNSALSSLAVYQAENSSSSGGYNESYFRQAMSSLGTMLAQGHPETAISGLDSLWGKLSAEQKAQAQKLLGQYGYQYEA